ncbi:MAG: ABC transporter permease subunit [Candidatus Devosia phytovorans]|uniref:ABC transporter permease subunit n=1 Tax=Candidatus Devosia phytovorans TaxID=3121372 RepID=A0AAJ5VUM1_9HYPH|nr:ABC transporter permease subunit [Devosia sp.]WEK03768.1 MAG: ABC transporter permease subunit [Devosia sp.]
MADTGNPPTKAADPASAAIVDKPGIQRSMAEDVAEAIRDIRKLVRWLRGVRAENWIVLLLAIALVCSWEWIATQFSRAIIPSMGETADAFFSMLQDDRRNYFNAVVNTIQNYYAGLGLAILVGWGLAGLMGLSPLLGQVMKVVLDFLGNIPIIAFMPLFVALLGLGAAAKIVIVLLAAAIVIATTAHAAFESVDRGAEEAARGLGANRLQAQFFVVWPQVLPQMIAGLRLGAAQALTACIIAEIYTAMTGLGGLIVGYGASFNMPRYFVAVLTTLAIGGATATVLRHLERRFAVP